MCNFSLYYVNGCVSVLVLVRKIKTQKVSINNNYPHKQFTILVLTFILLRKKKNFFFFLLSQKKKYWTDIHDSRNSVHDLNFPILAIYTKLP